MPRMIGLVAVASVMLASGPGLAQRATAAAVRASANSEAGQRQTIEQAAPGYEPLARIDTRIENRIQSRLRSRLDRYYDPQANAASPFAVAEEKTRTAARKR